MYEIKFRDFDYTVSSTGSIKRIKTGKLIRQGDVNGYKNVCLSKNGKHHYFRVHRMVAELFLKKTGEVVNHKNGIKDDNRVENLEWCTHSYNIKHSYDTLHRTRKKSDINSIYMFNKKMELISEFISLSECVKITGFNKGNISQCCNGKRKSANGFIFKYNKINRFKKDRL